jgi:hypothetical protein
MNLVFGQSEESYDFWNFIVLPEARHYYQLSADEIEMKEVRLNALYFAILEHVGLTLTVIDPVS